MLWHHGAAVHRKRVNVRKRSKMLALANGSLIEMHTPRHWALTINMIYLNLWISCALRFGLVKKKEQ